MTYSVDRSPLSNTVVQDFYKLLNGNGVISTGKIGQFKGKLLMSQAMTLGLIIRWS